MRGYTRRAEHGAFRSRQPTTHQGRAGVSTQPPRAATKRSRTSATDRMATPAEQLWSGKTRGLLEFERIAPMEGLPIGAVGVAPGSRGDAATIATIVGADGGDARSARSARPSSGYTPGPRVHERPPAAGTCDVPPVARGNARGAAVVGRRVCGAIQFVETTRAAIDRSWCDLLLLSGFLDGGMLCSCSRVGVCLVSRAIQ